MQCSVLAVQTSSGVHICQRSLLQRRSRAGVAAIQIGPHKLALQSLTGTTPMYLTTQLPVKGAHLSAYTVMFV